MPICRYFAQIVWATGLGHEARWSVSSDNRQCLFAALRETGATGLEPATSGVTGRYGATGYTITSYPFSSPYRLRPASTRHSLCGVCVVALTAA